jgi:hypothetical protein
VQGGRKRRSQAFFTLLTQVFQVSRARSRRRSDDQLSLPFAALDEEAFLEAMVARGVTRVRQIRFKANRTRIVSISALGSTLNVHECFRTAPEDVLDAVAAFVLLPQRSAAFRANVARMRAWWERQAEQATEPPRPAPTCATPAQDRYLRTLYRSLNRSHFGGRLPADLPLRLSARMHRRFGHVAYDRRRGRHVVAELALNADLMLAGNEGALLDTMLHEMAHAEAWLEHGHRGHGEPWRVIAERVGCQAGACSTMRLRRRRRSAPPDPRVPAAVQARPPKLAAKAQRR